MCPQLFRISVVIALLMGSMFILNAPTVRAESVSWTNLVSANTSGSSLTPTAASGHGESSQSIASGNGSLVVTAWSSGDGNWVSFGLTNGTFTGDRAEITYGWLSYGTVANCRLNGDALNNLINVAQGDTLEVRINGTTVEYYHNSTLVYSLTGQTLSYPYRAAATFSSSTAPAISNATITGTGGSGSTGVTWTNLVSANTSGSSLTPTAASGHGESSQSITSGNGSLVVTAWSSGDGNWASFGLTNGTFTGDRTQIKYGWLSYGTYANCRLNGEALNDLRPIAQGDTLEVRISGTTIEYYHNTTLVYSLTNQTLSYPYRAAATFTSSTAPPISSATMTGVIGGGNTGVTWTNLVSANTSGSSLTPTAAGGHGESSQSIASGNGSLVVTAWSSGDGNWASFGLTNGTFTGDRSQIKYGWLSYGTYANCRLNGDALNDLIPVAQGDTLEVRISGTTIEYYHNTTLVYSLASQTLSYPYRAAATFTSSSAPAISSATMTGGGGGSGPSIKTDRAVYPEPPLPTLPAAGGKFTDPVFGTQIMRVTDANECPAPGCGTWYSRWPTFNSNSTRLMFRRGVDGDLIIKEFDPVNFTLGAMIRTIATITNGYLLSWQDATWSRTDPDLIYVHAAYYETGATVSGMKLYTYRPSTNVLTLIKDLTQLAPGQPDYFFPMHVSQDGNDTIFTLGEKRSGYDDPLYFVVWNRLTDTVLQRISSDTTTNIHKQGIADKTGRWITFGTKTFGPDQPRARVLDLQTNTWQTMYQTAADDGATHGDFGHGFLVGRGDYSGGFNYRQLSNVHSWSILFDFKDQNGVTFWSGLHTTLHADDESWVTIGQFDEVGETGVTHPFEKEVMQIATDGSQRIRRLLHHHSIIYEQYPHPDGTDGYWGEPKPTISRDGQYIAFTSNWGDSGRYDLFIARIVPAQ